ncbi:MAG: class I SAM-dependent methyltransferase [Chloroflexota bacterium]
MSKALNKQRYSQFAEGYVRSITHAKGADLDTLVTIAEPQADWHVLDIATGGGHTALKFTPLVKSVIASDLTPTMLDVAEKFIREQDINNVAFKVADAEDLPFANEQFDLVTCRIAPHHFPDIAQFVRESARVLKVGGLLLVQDHVLPENSDVATIVDKFEKVRDPSHHHALSASAWIETFTDAGLTVKTTRELTKRHQFIDWAKRQGNDEVTIAQLVEMVASASDAVKAWMQAEKWGTAEASFVNHHIIVAGYKSDSKK